MAKSKKIRISLICILLVSLIAVMHYSLKPRISRESVILDYKRIYNIPGLNEKRESMYVVFIRGSIGKEEFGVIYAKNKDADYGLIMDLIGHDWYFHWMGYT